MNTITRMLKNVGNKRQAIYKKEPIPKFNVPIPNVRCSPIKRTPDMISKVKRLVDKKNPSTIATSSATNNGLQVIGISKKKQHLLFLQLIKLFIRIYQKILEQNWMFIILLTGIKNPKTNCRKLCEKHLAREKSEFAVILDYKMQ